MKNIFKKAAALAVAGLISVSALTACAQEVTLLDFIEADTGKTDFDGYVSTISSVFTTLPARDRKLMIRPNEIFKALRTMPI